MEWNGMEWNGMEWNGMEWKIIIDRAFLYLLVAVTTSEFHTLDELTNVFDESLASHAPSA